MSMSLTPAQLSEISTKVEELDHIGIEVRVIKVSGHDIYLRKDEGKGKHIVIGITDKPKDHHEGNMR